MKVACATEHMMSCFQDVYPDIFALNKRISEPDIDLLIFTGGADINPALYGQKPDGAIGWDVGRDKIETEIFSRFSRGRIKAKCILGVCRGQQILNVFYGGSLIQDMDHPGVHEVEWKVETPLNVFPIVNSLHHQAVQWVGGDATVLGVEPNTGIPEAILYRSNVLTVQFHPEFFGAEKKNQFFSLINEWVAGNLKMMKGEKPKPSTSSYWTFTSVT